MSTENSPTTLLEAIRHFADADACQSYLAARRWPDGVTCPHCGNRKLGYAPSVRLWRCAPCKKRFSVKVGTIFEASPLGLDKWLPCVWMLVNAKNGVSSCEMARSLGVTQKTAWFMLHRVREALRTGNFQKMQGIVEADETFAGGNADFMHKKRKKALGIGRGFTVKTIVMGLLEHGPDGESRVRAAIIQDTKKRTLLNQIRISVETGATIHTDAWIAYQQLGPEFVHRFVDHAVRYVEGPSLHKQAGKLLVSAEKDAQEHLRPCQRGATASLLG